MIPTYIKNFGLRILDEEFCTKNFLLNKSQISHLKNKFSPCSFTYFVKSNSNEQLIFTSCTGPVVRGDSPFNKETHLPSLDLPKPPVVLDLVLPEVHALPGAPGNPRVGPALGLFAIQLLDASLPALLLPQQIVFTQDAPVVAGLGSPQQVPWLKERQDIERQLKWTRKNTI